MQTKNLPGIIRTSLHVCKQGVVSSEIKNEILMSFIFVLVTMSSATFSHMTRGVISLCSICSFACSCIWILFWFIESLQYDVFMPSLAWFIVALPWQHPNGNKVKKSLHHTPILKKFLGQKRDVYREANLRKSKWWLHVQRKTHTCKWTPPHYGP